MTIYEPTTLRRIWRRSVNFSGHVAASVTSVYDYLIERRADQVAAAWYHETNTDDR